MGQRGLAPIVIVLLIAAAIGGYLVYYNQGIPKFTDKPSSYPQTSKPVNWKTYTNIPWNVSFKYPPDKEFFEGQPPETDLRIVIDDQISIQARKSNPTESLEDLSDHSHTSNILTKETVFIDGVEAIKITATTKDPDEIENIGDTVDLSFQTTYQTIILRHKNIDYFISVDQFKNADPNLFENKKPGQISESALKLFNQILSTFKFTQ